MKMVERFKASKRLKKKWAILTAYDALTAALLEKSGIELILVGDSLGMVLLGYSSTLPVTMDEMIHHAKAVRRGAKKAFVIGDMPLKGIEKGPRQALESARRFIREAGCDAVKLEWGKCALHITDTLIKHGIPVMGHVGLTPQSVKKKESFRVKGQDAGSALEILRAAKAFEKHGAFSVLLECVPSAVARVITESLLIPTLGIGAGPFCDGQVLVFHDMVGLFKKFETRFVKRYADLDSLAKKAAASYSQEVAQGRFPQKRHGFSMRPEELDKFRQSAQKLIHNQERWT